MNKYSEGKIYKIVNSIDDKIYIGSTIQPLNERFADHKLSAKKGKSKCKLFLYMLEIGMNNFSIVLLEEWPCDNKNQLLMREGYYQVQHNSIRNGLNTLYAFVFPFVVKIKHREYVTLHKDRILESQQRRRLENLEEYTKKDHEYKEANREYINKRGAVKYTCECGKIIRKDSKSTHIKSRYHIKYLSENI